LRQLNSSAYVSAVALALLGAASLIGCGHAPQRSTVTVTSLSPEAPRGPVQEGTASWYGREQQGGPTASGERFDMHALTAAHRTLRMNTRVRVTHLGNGRQVVVRINDRGPFSRGRIIDLSYAAARALGMLEAGVARVRLEVVP
jgi:rare lipoprotein A